jgi:hypothetical protein
MGYSNEESSVRVDFFKEYGKWYTTEAIIWTGSYSDGLIHDEFRKSLSDHFNGSKRLTGMWAVCLEPYHVNSHPLMIKWEG